MRWDIYYIFDFPPPQKCVGMDTAPASCSSKVSYLARFGLVEDERTACLFGDALWMCTLGNLVIWPRNDAIQIQNDTIQSWSFLGPCALMTLPAPNTSVLLTLVTSVLNHHGVGIWLSNCDPAVNGHASPQGAWFQLTLISSIKHLNPKKTQMQFYNK